MKNIYSFIILLFVFFNHTNSFSETNIAYLDMTKVTKKTKAGNSISKQLKKIHLSNIQKFEKIGKSLKDEESQIVSQKNLLEKNIFEEKIKTLREKAKNYRLDRNKAIEDLTKKRFEATNKLLNTINPILVEYSKTNSIDIIFQKKNIIVGKSDLDITDEIIKIVDKKISNIKLD